MVEPKEKIKELKEKNKRLIGVIEDNNKKEQQLETKTNIYYGIRFVQVLCIGVAVFGALWKGTEVMNLDTPGFMMVYGGSGALISEVIARLFKKKAMK